MKPEYNQKKTRILWKEVEVNEKKYLKRSFLIFSTPTLTPSTTNLIRFIRKLQIQPAVVAKFLDQKDLLLMMTAATTVTKDPMA